MNVPERTAFHELSYSSHAAHIDAHTQDRMCPAADSIGMWWQRKLLAPLIPLIELDPTARWLTIGDGRYGMDARCLLQHGVSAVASDISDKKLQEAHQAGLLPEYRRENAERLSCEDDSFDYLLCKECYHHCPRPPIAFYEMLRVCRKAVILIEPNDQFSPHHLGEFAFTLGREAIIRWFGRPSGRYSYETSGNYAYRLSRRELEKMALGINLPVAAFKYLNDYYIEGATHIRLGEGSSIEWRAKGMAFLHNLAAAIGIKPYRLLVAVIFKKEPPPEATRALRATGFEVKVLPRNPYLGDK